LSAAPAYVQKLHNIRSEMDATRLQAPPQTLGPASFFEPLYRSISLTFTAAPHPATS
jgi:hypothetical protein